MKSAEIPVEDQPLCRRLAAEALGTAALLAAVVGSGIMAERLTQDIALALLCNTIATAAMLFVLIVVFAPVSGAHFNPAVTLVALLRRAIPLRGALFYVVAQIISGILGVWLAHAMFGEALFAWGVKARSGFAQNLSEAVATFGLVLTIAGASGRSRETVAAAVALYIGSAYWFTASTSFANPAVTLARSLTPSFAGIRPADAPAFIAAQLMGALLAAVVARTVFPTPIKRA
ncbi:MAG TPA: MIP/aquaporin family protein [Micropepsaceae bacterium]|nr:MIP/aquaporin family protein [Micropepsaceae bacterium]